VTDPGLAVPGSGLALAPDEAPNAPLSVTPPKHGLPTAFDASASTVRYGTIKHYAWNFGDGAKTTTNTATINHTYATAGTYAVTVTETDSAGTSTKVVFTGQTVLRNGGPSARAHTKLAIP
jgi:PKD repeat protein